MTPAAIAAFAALAAVAEADERGVQVALAAAKGDSRRVEHLVQRGAPVDARAPGTWATPLILAACGGHVAVVEYLLAHGADPNEQDLGALSPLIIASGAGHLPIVEALLASGAHIDHCAWETALSAAASNSHTEIVRALLRHGAGVNVACNNQPPGMHAKWGARDSGDGGSLATLVAAGATFESFVNEPERFVLTSPCLGPVVAVFDELYGRDVRRDRVTGERTFVVSEAITSFDARSPMENNPITRRFACRGPDGSEWPIDTKVSEVRAIDEGRISYLAFSVSNGAKDPSALRLAEDELLGRARNQIATLRVQKIAANERRVEAWKRIVKQQPGCR